MRAANLQTVGRRHRHRGDNGPKDNHVRLLIASAATWPDSTAFIPLADENPTRADDDAPLKILLVNAHPDDESEAAGLVYRITHERGGVADQVVVTNGEAGSRFSTPAEAYYRLRLASDAGKPELLSQIRREELMRASRILGIRNTYFLSQEDTGPSFHPADALRAWDIVRVKHELSMLLQFGNYQLVLLLLPTSDTHGHHQAVAALTLELIAGMEAYDRPAVLGVRSEAGEAESRENFSELPEYPVTRATTAEPLWTFNRRKPLECHAALDYTIIANWVIAEHKSQGFFQMEFARKTRENYWLFAASGAAGAARWRDVLQQIGSRQAEAARRD